jgi:DNA-binding CsgD family transcriptional regulator
MRGDLDSTLFGGDPPLRPAMWRRAQLAPAQIGEVQRRYAEGETASALAVEFGVSAATVRFYVGPRWAW